MTKERLWEIYTKRNPSFLEGNTTLTPSGLKAFFDQTWDMGDKHGQAVSKATNAGLEGDGLDFLKSAMGMSSG